MKRIRVDDVVSVSDVQRVHRGLLRALTKAAFFSEQKRSTASHKQCSSWNQILCILTEVASAPFTTLKRQAFFAHVSLLVGIASFALVCITGSLKVKLPSPAYNPHTPTHEFCSPADLLTDCSASLLLSVNTPWSVHCAVNQRCYLEAPWGHVWHEQDRDKAHRRILLILPVKKDLLFFDGFPARSDAIWSGSMRRSLRTTVPLVLNLHQVIFVVIFSL